MDVRCYFITGHGRPDKIASIAAEAARGGASVVQVRSKPISTREVYFLAEQVSVAVHAANPQTKVLIDDHVAVASSLIQRGFPVHGVHLGQSDLPATIARQLLGPDAIIGLTTGTMRLVEESNELSGTIDYIGAGPFRPSPTKDSGREPIGLEGYPALVAASKLPIVAIGDVQPEDVEALSATGVSGVAMVRSFMESEDPAALAAYVRDRF